MHKLDLSFRIEGEGETVVFLHGFLESSSMWKYLPLKRLPIKAVFVDLPGHGDSSISVDELPSIQSMAERVAYTLKKNGIDEYSLVGHSMGGYVGLELMNSHEGIKKLILLNSNCWSDSEAKKVDRKRVADIVFKSKNLFLNEAIPNLFLDARCNKAEIEDLIAEASLIKPEAIAYASNAMAQRANYCDLLNKKALNCYVIQGEGDRVVPMKQMQDVLSDKEIHFYVLQHTGHMAHIENPEDVMAILSGIFPV